MSFPTYEIYEDSGVDWLGDVPSHWDVPPCRSIVTERTNRNDDGGCEDYLSLMANVGVIPYAEKGDIGNKKPEDLTKCKMVHENDFVINSMNYYIGSYGVSQYNGVCSPVYIVLTPKDDVVDARYAFRIFEIGGFQEYAQSFGNGILEHRRSINWDILKTIPVPVPPPDEQKAIASFLDSETSKIDALVSEQRRLIELLKEKRQAVISLSVTKGLRPNLKMKDTGVESVAGNLKQQFATSPSHWRIGKVKNAGEVCVGRQRTPKHQTGEHIRPYLRVANVLDGRIDYDDILSMNFDPTEQRRFGLVAGDVLLNEGQSLELVGRPAVYRGPTHEYCFQNTLVRFRAYQGVDPEFAYFVFKHWLENGFFRLFARQTTNIAHLGGDRFANMPFPMAPISEQRAIAKHLDEETSRFDTLITQTERAIELLQERRTALISAAVTGKIDVRGYKPKEAVA